MIANRATGVPGTDARELRFISVAPNPSAGFTSLGFSLPHTGEAIVVMTDLQGRQVRHLVGGLTSAGRHEAVWDGRDDSDKGVAPGVYFAVLRFENRTIWQRVVRIR